MNPWVFGVPSGLLLCLATRVCVLYMLVPPHHLVITRGGVEAWWRWVFWDRGIELKSKVRMAFDLRILMEGRI